MGDYAEALAQSPVHPDVTATRAFGRIKYGFAASANQELIPGHLGMFTRLSWNDGHTESWSYTEVDASAAVGAVLTGAAWRRPDDDVGAAVVVSGLSEPHRRYLAAGGHGFIIGDGALRYGPEVVGEIYYKAQVTSYFAVSAIYQPVINPAYNQDRGPIHFFGCRIRAAF
jgi:high affinity Mn2+ porin